MLNMKLSIITINRNNAEGLQKTIESIINQKYQNFEYIVIDGASTDNSIDVIKKYDDGINIWVSEPDKGIYSAMNKGILKASGEYCLFLNSGDWLVDDSTVDDFLDENFTKDFIAGTVNYVNGNSRQYIQPTQKQLTYDFFVKDSLMHAATFIKRELFDKYGLYNENYRIVSDWEFFFMMLIVKNCTYTIFNRVIANFDLQGISNLPSWTELHKNEKQQVLAELLPRMYPMHLELEHLRAIKQEYDFLKEGKFGFLVRLILKLKAIKKK